MASNGLKGWHRVRITCQGITPLLMLPHPEESIVDDLIYKKAKSEKAKENEIKDKTLVKMAAENVYLGPNGEYGIPRDVMFACLRNGGQEVSFKGATKVTTQKSTRITRFFTILDNFIPLIGDPSATWTMPTSLLKGNNPEDLAMLTDEIGAGTCPWKVDVKRGVMSSGMKSVAVGIVRPRFDEWGFSMTIRVNYDYTDEPMMRAIIENAGVVYGLMSFRPQCRGEYGQFEQTGYDVLD